VATDGSLAPGLHQARGTVVGLDGQLELSLRSDGESESLTISADGSFSFQTLMPAETFFEVRVDGQPLGQHCVFLDSAYFLAGDGGEAEISCEWIAPRLTNLEVAAPALLQPPLVLPSFNPTINSYETTVSLLGAEATILATSLDPNATILVNGVSVASGDIAQVPLYLGVNVVVIEVMAISGESATYEVTVDRLIGLQPSNADFGDAFGISIATSGDTLAVGAFAEEGNATGIDGDLSDNSLELAGAVYIFRRENDAWVQEAYLKASNTEERDFFGHKLALSGNTLAVATANEDSSASGINGDQTDNGAERSGAVYIFQRTGTTWEQEAYVKASNNTVGLGFGESVALDGDVLAVGAPYERSISSGVNQPSTGQGFETGAVYVFRRTGNTWAQEAFVKASNSEQTNSIDAADRFGESVGVSGDLLAVGASREDSGAEGINGNQSSNALTDSGAVYVFRRGDTDWAQEAYIKASNPGSSDYFGERLVIDGDTLVVTAPSEASNATGVGGNELDDSEDLSGAAYVFRNSGGTWAQEAYLKASNTEGGDRFGTSLALSQDSLAIAAVGEDSGVAGDPADNSSSSSGAAYRFSRNGSDWTQGAYVKSRVISVNGAFGTSVAVSGSQLFVGTPFQNADVPGLADGGVVHIFD
tara:strand:- start:280 stop:2223 length:1944 start_codon:yes stop_codon:yes gene_type:complete